jgi:L-lactate dehydrogenase complex protein LldG
MNREAFLSRVRTAAAAGRAYRVKTRDGISAHTGYCGAGEDKVARMASEVEAVGGRSHVVADMNSARETLAALLEQYDVRKALCWQHPVLTRLGLGDLLANRGITLLNHNLLTTLSPDEQRAEMFAADIGISSATFGIAETGTLAMASGPGSERLASLLPPVHVAIIEADQILPDLFDLFAMLGEKGPDQLPSNLTLITGPSKTGDLELKLTTGVHGPGKWHVVIVRGAGL